MTILREYACISCSSVRLRSAVHLRLMGVSHPGFFDYELRRTLRSAITSVLCNGSGAREMLSSSDEPAVVASGSSPPSTSRVNRFNSFLHRSKWARASCLDRASATSCASLA